MKSSKHLEYRMYFLTPYNLSPMQAGIQQIHGVVEYMLRFGETDDYLNWAHNWKTVQVLNGGTSNNLGYHHYENSINQTVEPFVGSMEIYHAELEKNGITHATFYEPDANNMMTSITFLCDERVFKDRQKVIDDVYYPDFTEWLQIEKSIFRDDSTVQILEKDCPEEYKEWVKFIGGEKNVFLRSFIKTNKLKFANN